MEGGAIDNAPARLDIARRSSPEATLAHETWSVGARFAFPRFALYQIGRLNMERHLQTAPLMRMVGQQWAEIALELLGVRDVSLLECLLECLAYFESGVEFVMDSRSREKPLA